tara:strand:- start:2075 stop:3169 length:1095 start_codon:yes stop_codon:yes gene_type:complete
MKISNYLKNIVDTQKVDQGFHQLFFTDENLFKLSFEAIFKKQWVFVTHLSHFDKNEDFIYNLTDGYVSIKKLEGKYEAFHSDKSKVCHIKLFEHLVFINLSENPYDFDEFIKPLVPYIKMHGLKNGKIAFQKDYIFNASHLATIQNFKECNHCWGGEFSHKDYLDVHGSTYCNSYGAGVGSGIESDEFNKRLEKWTKETTDKGLFVNEFSESDSKFFRVAERTPLKEGILSETRDGSYSCTTLMGDFKKYGPDGGYTAVGFSPFNSFVANNEFSILFVFSPVSKNKTIVTQMWITDKEADCDIEKMIFLWDRTTLEDSQLCEMNQKGIESIAYSEGIYGSLEKSLILYQKFFLDHLQDHLKSRA